MTEKEKMLSGELYEPWDPELNRLRAYRQEQLHALSNVHAGQVEERAAILKNLLGRMGTNVMVEQGFFCDYGCFIEVGDNFFANNNLTILDCAPVIIGDNVMIGPQVGIYTAGHPLDAETRRRGREFAHPITIGNDVWIGGGSTILPSVTIGDGAVIGAGSVVTKDIPAGWVAVGNPCKPLKKV